MSKEVAISYEHFGLLLYPAVRGVLKLPATRHQEEYVARLIAESAHGLDVDVRKSIAREIINCDGLDESPAYDHWERALRALEEAKG